MLNIFARTDEFSIEPVFGTVPPADHLDLIPARLLPLAPMCQMCDSRLVSVHLQNPSIFAEHEGRLRFAARFRIDPGVVPQIADGHDIADVGLFDLILHRPRPDNVATDVVIVNSRIAQDFKAGGKFFLAPFVLHAEMVVAVLVVGPDVTLHHLVAMLGMFIEMDHAVFNGNDLIGIAIVPVLLQKGIPAVEILSVKKRAESIVGLLRCLLRVCCKTNRCRR